MIALIASHASLIVGLVFPISIVDEPHGKGTTTARTDVARPAPSRQAAVLGDLCQPAIGSAKFGDRLGYSRRERAAESTAVIGRQ